MNQTKQSRRKILNRIKSKVMPLMQDSGVSVDGKVLMVYSTIDHNGNVAKHRLGTKEFFGICDNGLLMSVDRNGLVTVPWCAVTLEDLEKLGKMVEQV